MRSLFCLGAPLLAMACGQPTSPGADPSSNPNQTRPSANPVSRTAFQSFASKARGAALAAPTRGGRPTSVQVAPQAPATVHLPQIGDHALFSTGGTGIVQSGATAGSATYTGAVVLDPNAQQAPAALGTGSYDVTAGGTQFTSAAAETIAYTAVDPSNNVEYVVVGAFTSSIDPNTQAEIGDAVYIVAPSADFAAGASVALDGVDRVAIFFHGDTSLPDPEIVAAALTGTITFGQGSLAVGGTVDATLAGDFEDIQLTPSNPNPSPSPSPSPSPGGWISAGTYNLAYDATANVQCDGTLTGQEAAFAGLVPADFGLADSVVTLTLPAADAVEVSGLVGFSPAGSVTLLTDPQAPPGLYFVDLSGAAVPGPAGSSRMGTGFMLDGDSASPTMIYGAAVFGFLSADQQGYCDLAFGASLTP